MPSSQTGPIPDAGQPSGHAIFATTHWSVVLTAGSSDAPQAQDALEKLCQTYWYPLYAYVRRRGNSPADAEDLTQEFFARLLERNWVAEANPDRGRFRSFLLDALNHFLAKEWRKGRAQKRGGGVQMMSLDSAETRYGNEPADGVTPEQQFERKWALTLLGVVLQRLCAEFEREHQPGTFEFLRPCLVGDRDAQPYSAISAKLDMSEGAVKVAVHRLRRRYRQLLREEVAQTVASSDEVDNEVHHLITVLASG
jgi:RNA polymerase sigma-70 factor (ECF subfamily)